MRKQGFFQGDAKNDYTNKDYVDSQVNVVASSISNVNTQVTSHSAQLADLTNYKIARIDYGAPTDVSAINEKLTAFFEFLESTGAMDSSNEGFHLTAYDIPAITAKGNTVYQGINTNLKRSTDGGVTWSAYLKDIAPNYFTGGIIKDDGVVILYDSVGVFYRSTNGTTFDVIDMSTFGTVRSPQYHGIEYNGETIVFGEYGTSVANYRIFTSVDNGLTWDVTLTKANPAEIRHWHSINYFSQEGYFIATSGDSDSQVTWWKSVDGITWTAITGVGNQDFRTLNLQYIGNGKIMWGSDAAYGVQSYVCTASLSDIVNTKTRIIPVTGACWHLQYHDGLYVACTSAESGTTNLNAYLYTSTDGINWRLSNKQKLDGSYTFGGFRTLWYLDVSNKWIFRTYGISGALLAMTGVKAY